MLTSRLWNVARLGGFIIIICTGTLSRTAARGCRYSSSPSRWRRAISSPREPHTTPHHTAPNHSALHRTTPHPTTPYHTTPHYTAPHRTIPHYTTTTMILNLPFSLSLSLSLSAPRRTLDVSLAMLFDGFGVGVGSRFCVKMPTPTRGRCRRTALGRPRCTSRPPSATPR